MPKAVFMIPSQHKDASHFLEVAQHCRKKHWGPANAVIFKVFWNGSYETEPSFSAVDSIPAGFSPSFWSSMAAADQFVPLCHCGVRDGPMLGPEGQHPWPSVPGDQPDAAYGNGEELTERAKAFWRRASWAIGSDGKFLLAGCDSGKMYGPLVAKLVSLKVYGFKEHIGTARIDVADLYIGGQFLHNQTGHNVIKC